MHIVYIFTADLIFIPLSTCSCVRPNLALIDVKPT